MHHSHDTVYSIPLLHELGSDLWILSDSLLNKHEVRRPEMLPLPVDHSKPYFWKLISLILEQGTQ